MVFQLVKMLIAGDTMLISAVFKGMHLLLHHRIKEESQQKK